MPDDGLGAGRYLAPAAVPAKTTTTAHQLTTSDGATVNGLLRTVPGATTVAFLMHPRQDFSHHVLVPELLSQGYAVWTQGTRSVGNDLTLLHEQALLDLAAGHVYLRDKGFAHVVLIGHSGGAALGAFYLQQAARTPEQRLSRAPSGKPVELGKAEMPMADGFLMMAPHPGQGALLLRLIDPSVVDERDPRSATQELDPYHPGNGFAEPPGSSKYDEEFIAEYRQAQYDRIARIDARARELAAESAAARRRYRETNDPADRRTALATGVLTVYRTDADLRSVDLSLDPNDRPYGSLFGRRPDLTNYGVLGFGRLTTPDSWLSTWSAISGNADLAACLPDVTVPTQLVELTGDQACFPADAKRFSEISGAGDVTHVRVPGRHFGAPLHDGMTSGATLAGAEMGRWLDERFPRE
ncbi:alpha/beta hydrolase [Amycolatopsis jejuensis]|uniref:alpha/beta hydrolase n=1 Tax=Amycolatopsis jejuensis TaxID=330084 RepID=UPI000526C850|nr:alpha/beta hydrolase [Amycolatopsis jejuensis]